VNMEFNQEVDGFKPMRKPGDLLIAYDLSGAHPPDLMLVANLSFHF